MNFLEQDENYCRTRLEGIKFILNQTLGEMQILARKRNKIFVIRQINFIKQEVQINIIIAMINFKRRIRRLRYAQLKDILPEAIATEERKIKEDFDDYIKFHKLVLEGFVYEYAQIIKT